MIISTLIFKINYPLSGILAEAENGLGQNCILSMIKGKSWEKCPTSFGMDGSQCE